MNGIDFWLLVLYPAILLIHLSVLVVSSWNLWGSLCTISSQLFVKYYVTGTELSSKESVTDKSQSVLTG